MKDGLERPIVFDISHLVSRLTVRAPTGIDRVDLMFGRYFAGAMPRIAAATHYSLRQPNLLSPDQAQAIVRRVDQCWLENRSSSEDPQFDRIKRWIENAAALPEASTSGALPLADFWTRYALTWKYRLTLRFGGRVPDDAIYLNVAQYLFEDSIFLRWLDRRPDIAKVFFVHDLLPLDYPEFFRDGHQEKFERRVSTILHHATALLVSSEAVAVRIKDEFVRRRRPHIPIHIEPLPPPIANAGRRQLTPIAAAIPYFVAVGTIEPRKNHIFLLNLWRELARGPHPVPRLLIIGGRGWENHQVTSIIDRSNTLRPHIMEVSGLASDALSALIASACALLMPSFDEGFGLPIVEALTLGTPIIASDIPVFREVSKGHATFLSPIDGIGWLSAIREASSNPQRQRENRAVARSPVRGFEDYFESVSAFLRSL